MDYETLRHFADSWGLLVLFLIFLGIIVFVWRPGARQHYEDAADVPFRHEKGPTGLDGNGANGKDNTASGPGGH